MGKKRALHGYTFRSPGGDLDYRIVPSIEAAQSNAAFQCERPYSYITWPDDWNRAYEQGFRIVPATLVSGRGNGAWKNPQPEKKEIQ